MEENVFDMDSTELDAARELRFAAEQLVELLAPHKQLFTAEVADALSECQDAVAKANAMPWG